MNTEISNFVEYKSEILDIKELTSDVKEITFKKPEEINHLPGQFVSIKFPNGNDFAYRAYSLLYDENQNLQICVKLFPGGKGSSFLFTKKAGESLDILYPFGYFGLPKKLSKNLYFIGTGTGIVPLLSLIESFDENHDNNLNLIFGVREEKDIFYQDRLSKLKEKLNLNYLTLVSRPSEDYKGQKGRVTDHLENIDKEGQFFICGNGEMIKSVRAKLQEMGVKEKNIFFEDFNE